MARKRRYHDFALDAPRDLDAPASRSGSLFGRDSPPDNASSTSTDTPDPVPQWYERPKPHPSPKKSICTYLYNAYHNVTECTQTFRRKVCRLLSRRRTEPAYDVEREDGPNKRRNLGYGIITARTSASNTEHTGGIVTAGTSTLDTEHTDGIVTAAQSTSNPEQTEHAEGLWPSLGFRYEPITPPPSPPLPDNVIETEATVSDISLTEFSPSRYDEWNQATLDTSKLKPTVPALLATVRQPQSRYLRQRSKRRNKTPKPAAFAPAEHEPVAPPTPENEEDIQRLLAAEGDKDLFPVPQSEELSFLPDAPESEELSFLPDAPEDDAVSNADKRPNRRRIGFASKRRIRPFYEDSVVSEPPLDSFVEDVTAFSDDPVEGTSALSLEASKELTPQKPARVEKVEVSALVRRPLLPRLDKTRLAVVVKASEMTNGGRVEKDIVPGKISTRDIKTLLPTEFNGDPLAWLNDNIVNEYMNLLIDHEKRKAGYVHRKNGPAPPVHAFPSQWWVSASRDLKSVQRWATRKQFGGKNLLDVKLLFIPVCVKSHWRLIAIKPQERIIEYLDSLSSGQDAQILQKVFEWLQQELGADFIASEWNVIEKQRSMRQQNGSDCGVFTCLNALALLRGEDPDLVEVDNGMHNARRIIAASLISGKLQGELEG